MRQFSARCWEVFEMEKRGSMQIREIFRFRDGRTVFVGSLEGGEHAMIRPGQCDLYVGDKKVATIRIEPEMIPQRVDPLERHNERAVSTTDDPGLTKEAVAAGICRLEVPM